MKNRLYILVFLCVITLFGVTGCDLKKDSMQDIEIITSSYPIEYLVTRLYENEAKVENIYPDGENLDTYKFNNKQLSKFSEKDLFIYNGKNASDIALNLINKNHSLLLIDSARGMNTTYGDAELWLDPSNMLMMSLNIKNGLQKYITNRNLNKNIDTNYNDLKIELSELDASYKLAVTQAEKKTIVVEDASLGFLEKYGIDIIVLNEDSIEKTSADVKKLAEAKKISKIFVFDEKTISEKVSDITSHYDVEVVELEKLDCIDDDQRNNDLDYISIMKKNLDLIKEELYKE